MAGPAGSPATNRNEPRSGAKLAEKSEVLSPLQSTGPARLARFHWVPAARAALVAGGTQAAIHLVTLLTGLAVVRLLPVQEYAYYTIVNAMLGTLLVLTDGGASESVLAQGGRVWRDRDALGGVVAGGLRLRRRLATVAALVSIPVAWILLRNQGASAAAAALLIACAMPLFLTSLTSQLLEIVPRLHQAVWPLQRVQLLGHGLRFVAVLGGAAVWPVAWLVSLVTGMAQLWSTLRIRSLAREVADWHRPPDPDAWSRMVSYVRRAMPGAIYFAFAGQIVVWLISLFGNTESVAQVGALTRLAMVLNLLTSVSALVVTPRFARLPDRGGAPILSRYWQMQGAFAFLLLLVVGVVAMSPGTALRVLGPEYAGLTHEVVLVAFSGALGVLAASAYSMSAARGIVVAPIPMLLSSLLTQIVLIGVLPLDTVAGVLWLGALGNAFSWLLYAGYFSLSCVRSREPSVSGKSA